MNVGIICLPERGSYNPALSLAEALRERGHRVVFFASASFELEATTRGFECARLFDETSALEGWDVEPLPEGRLVRLVERVRRARASARDPERWAWTKAVAEGRFARLLRERELDLVLVDFMWQAMIPHVMASGARVRLFATELSGGTRAAPPTTSPHPSRPGLLGAIGCRLAWAERFARWHVRAVRAAIQGLAFEAVAHVGAPKPPKSLRRRYRKRLRQVARYGRHVPTFWEYGWTRYPPDVFLCCRALDFPEARAHRVYLGPCIDLARADVAFPWHRLVSDGPLVYVSLGTHASLYARKTLPFLQRILAVAKQMPAARFVVVTGTGRRPEDVGVAPPNAVVVEAAPQIALLPRAQLVVTNGGLGTVKEAIWFAVPMIVVPCAWDQPGNAARVVHHGLGVRADVEDATVAELRALIEEVLANRAITGNIRAMSERFRSSRELEVGLPILLARP